MRCVVLMSTYNGENYIAEQLQSILVQLPDDGELIIRDDGSSDGTVSVIRRFHDVRIKLYQEKNIGFAQSFFELMRRAPAARDLYLLADQDDVWLRDKIQRAWQCLARHTDRPFLYCTVTQLVDAQLRPIGLGRRASPDADLVGALTENQVTGCTIAMNWKLLSLALPSKAVIKDVHFHDWWLYVVAVAFGEIYCDDKPTILYRQHGGNYIGYGAGFSRYLKMLLFLFRQNWLASLAAQVNAFRLNFSARLSREQMGSLEAIHRTGGRLRRFSMLFAMRRHRPSWAGELLLRLLLVCDWRR